MKMNETGNNISKSQTYGRLKNPRCENCNKYKDGFPLSWTRKQTDQHEKECKNQGKLFE